MSLRGDADMSKYPTKLEVGLQTFFWCLTAFLAFVAATVHQEPVAPWMKIFATCFFAFLASLVGIIACSSHFALYRLHDKWMWNPEFPRLLVIVFTVIGITLTGAFYSLIGAHSVFFLMIPCIFYLIGISFRVTGRKVQTLKNSISIQEGEMAEALIVVGAIESPGVAVLKDTELMLAPIVGNRHMLKTSDIVSVRETSWFNGTRLFWKKGFLLDMAGSDRFGFAIPRTIARRWANRLNKEPETPDTPKAAKMATTDTSQPIYTSSVRSVSKEQRYRVYSDRIELDFKFLFTRTFVIPADEIIDIWVSHPTTLRDIPRIGGIKAVGRGLKLDLADLFRHVGIHCRRRGWFKAFFFVPQDPEAFVNVVRTNLMD
jgi:hypothetical protein